MKTTTQHGQLMDDDGLVEKAMLLDARYCRDHGLVFQQPAKPLCGVEGGIVTLKNMRGVTARYRATGSPRRPLIRAS